MGIISANEQTPEVIIENTHKFDYKKNQNFLHDKNIINKIKRQVINRENVFKAHITNKVQSFLI